MHVPLLSLPSMKILWEKFLIYMISIILNRSVVVVDSLFIIAFVVWGFCVWSLLCNVVLGVFSKFAIILLRKRELVALL